MDDHRFELDKGVGRGTMVWDLLAGDVPFPAAVLNERRMRHNLGWMRAFIDAYGLSLAPHGKTTMAPKLFQRQLDAGAWGITVATSQQAEVAAAHGVRRILIANQIVGAANLAAVADLAALPGMALFCIADSAAGVALLGAACRRRGVVLDVLIELAPEPDQPGFRTGVRDAAGLDAVLAELERWRGHLRLSGVEFYEGVLPDEGEVRRFVRRAAATTTRLLAEQRFDRMPAILSGAGSAWYDVVADETAPLARSGAVEIVLRPGCYISHDDGLYRIAQEQILKRNAVAPRFGEALLPALRIWAVVQSLPDPARAIIAMGKRDVAFDAGMPRPATLFRPGRDDRPGDAPPHWAVTGLMDQHAYLTIAPEDDIAVGDVIAFDISHPCLTFDKWRRLLVVDDDYRCTEVIETFF
ncbi:amino acid deaminase [Sphingomonas sp. NFR15]|uniref:amino acid deaminase n=1 Tax=Sphingomonas sp. NFR15 TaxID=1566282 RepID=UPI000881997B|nr:amino acid deaminase [Sphingomonas sp. NFR15]SDA24622.1 D-serine dehydratase [Sphingomonas sp. NFR15]